MSQQDTPSGRESDPDGLVAVEKPQAPETVHGLGTQGPAGPGQSQSQSQNREYPPTPVALLIMVSCLLSMFLLSLVCASLWAWARLLELVSVGP